jgi:hypothetical protein
MDDPETVPEFHWRQPFPVTGALGVLVLCAISAGLWAALIWSVLAVVH